MKAKTKITGLLRSFYFALCGVFSCLKTERNMRIHFSVVFFVLVFSRFYDFSKAELGLLFVFIALVIAAEMLNTSIEAIVDMASPQYCELAKRAKDIAAGAVLVSAVFAATYGFYLFWDMKAIYEMLGYLRVHPMRLALLGMSALLWIWFIFSVESSQPKDCQTKKKN
ncbi:MAG: diacylglycerol kinase family protein [Oscillospiraceae bacterium]